ncbi:hypothetical protein NL108_013163 [Boleophthalmus pectinirostris]|nr:hypothetical protein NL108_013163 [Boleophthalmus pectinirostris]
MQNIDSQINENKRICCMFFYILRVHFVPIHKRSQKQKEIRPFQRCAKKQKQTQTSLSERRREGLVMLQMMSSTSWGGLNPEALLDFNLSFSLTQSDQKELI